MIDHNTISGTGIDGIGADGIGTIIEGNYLTGNHCYTGIGGGQIATYSGANTIGMVVANNTVIGGCASYAGGIEINSTHTVVSGNVVRNMPYFGIALDAQAGYVDLIGNHVANSAQQITPAS